MSNDVKFFEEMKDGEKQLCERCETMHEKGMWFLCRKYNKVRICDACQDKRR